MRLKIDFFPFENHSNRKTEKQKTDSKLTALMTGLSVQKEESVGILYHFVTQ